LFSFLKRRAAIMQSWLQSYRHIITVNLAVGVLQARQAGDTAGCHCDDKDCLRHEVNKTVSENLHASIQFSLRSKPLQIERFATETKTLAICASKSSFPATATIIEASSLDQSGEYLTIRHFTAFSIGSMLFTTKVSYFEYSSITLLGFTYSPNAL
jgi:hypothetical protein